MVRMEIKSLKFYKDLIHRAFQEEHRTEMNRPAYGHSNITAIILKFYAELDYAHSDKFQ
jgi:hypothetical protein